VHEPLTPGRPAPGVAHRSGPGPATLGWKCFAITTVDRPDRAARLERELRRVGLPYSIQRSAPPADAGGFASPGTRGCFDAHLMSLRAARADGVEVAVLVEDDVVVARRFPGLHRRLVDELDGLDWTMLYLGYLDSSPIRASPIHPATPHIAAAEGWEVTGAHFVAVRGSELDDLIADFEVRLEPGGHRIPADGVLNEHRRDHCQRTWVCLPNLARQGPSPSGITRRATWRASALRFGPVRAVAWPVKRLWWDLQSLVPPTRRQRRWNRRARRLEGAGPGRQVHATSRGGDTG
jgi:glycosyl transferase, family 25